MREPGNFCFQNYGTQNRIAEVQAIVSAKLSADDRKTLRPAPINIGILSPETDHAKVLSCPWGMTGDEIRLVSAAAHFLSTFQLPLYYAVVSDKDMDERDIRNLIRTFKAELAKEQGREKMRGQLPMAPAYVEILEGCAGVHSNILFPLRQTRAAPCTELAPVIWTDFRER